MREPLKLLVPCIAFNFIGIWVENDLHVLSCREEVRFKCCWFQRWVWNSEQADLSIDMCPLPDIFGIVTVCRGVGYLLSQGLELWLWLPRQMPTSLQAKRILVAWNSIEHFSIFRLECKNAYFLSAGCGRTGYGLHCCRYSCSLSWILTRIWNSACLRMRRYFLGRLELQWSGLMILFWNQPVSRFFYIYSLF